MPPPLSLLSSALSIHLPPSICKQDYKCLLSSGLYSIVLHFKITHQKRCLQILWTLIMKFPLRQYDPTPTLLNAWWITIIPQKQTRANFERFVQNQQIEVNWFSEEKKEKKKCFLHKTLGPNLCRLHYIADMNCAYRSLEIFIQKGLSGALTGPCSSFNNA